MQQTYDVVVIGSGFGGAITSCRLAQAGRSVCVLERGRKWDKTEFPRAPAEVARSFWRKGESLGFLEYKTFEKMDIIQGCGVGGGSLHYFNVHLRAPAEVVGKKGWPSQVTRSVLDPYYTLAEGMLDSEPLAPPAGRDLPLRTQAFMAAVAATERKAELVPIGVYTGVERVNPHSGLPQAPCDYSGNCMIGCVLHAKNTLDLNYLPLAKQNGAEIFPLHQADKIEPLGEEGYRVHFEVFDPGDPRRSEPGSVVGRRLVLAGGTLGTTELLLRSRDVHRTLPGLSPMLGMHFSGNGDFILAGTMDADRVVDPSRGPSITAGADFSTPENRIFIEDLGYPDPFIWLLEGAIPRTNRLADLMIAAVTYLLDTVGAGRGRISFEADRLFRGGATTRLLPYLGMGSDAADGRLQLSDGQIDLKWSHRHSRGMFAEMETALKSLSSNLGGEYVTSLLWRWPLRKLLTAHPLGGCFMGESKELSVTNPHGEVWDYPGLYVADGSLIPTALSVNPSLTVSALAERVAFWMIHQREMLPGDGQTPKDH
ncbi:MAG: GMC family oxidoreductase [Acidobacteriia bacterium]|nr:GMC family oxidoreductase [Terriglobia bacterium]